MFPLQWASAFDSQVGELIFQSLVAFDPESGRLAPQLAERLPERSAVTEGPYAGTLRVRFRLREGARFADGEPVEPADVVTTYKLTLYPGLANPQVRAGMQGLREVAVATDDPRAVDFFIERTGLLADQLAVGWPILPAHVYDEAGALARVDFATIAGAADETALPEAARGLAAEARLAPFGKTRVVGSGAYRLADWEEGRVLRLVRDSAFWGAAIDEALFWARPDTIEFYTVPDPTAALLQLENGGLDVMSNVSAPEALRLRDDPAGRFRLYTPLQQTRTFVYLNTADPLLADADTRRGLAHLMDVRFFLDSVQLGFGEPLHGPYHPSQSYAAGTMRPVGFSVDSARAAFARAGWADGDADGVLERTVGGRRQELRLEYLYPAASEVSETLALLFADDARAGGVAVTPVGKELGALFGDLAERRFQLVQGALGGDALPDDPYPMWHTGANTAGGKNRSGFGDDASDAVIDSILASSDESLRPGLYARLAGLINDAQPVINLIVPRERVVVRRGLEPVIMERHPGYYLPGFRLADADADAGASE